MAVDMDSGLLPRYIELLTKGESLNAGGSFTPNQSSVYGSGNHMLGRSGIAYIITQQVETGEVRGQRQRDCGDSNQCTVIRRRSCHRAAYMDERQAKGFRISYMRNAGHKSHILASKTCNDYQQQT